MIRITICICTRRRQEGLKNLLESLENMKTPSYSIIRIVVVENDIQNQSENIVNEFFLRTKLNVSYHLETRQGLAYARNRSVIEASGSDFCCFVDDDQVVDPNWLVELIKCQREFDADGVCGINPPIFASKVPLYIRQFHMPQIYSYGTIVKKAWTNCLLLRKEYLDRIRGPFDLRLNFTGGEDRYLTYLISTIGGVIRFNPYAIAYERISDDRATIKYVIKRVYRTSNTGIFVDSLEDNQFSKLIALPRLILRFCYGFLIIIPYLLLGKADKLKGLKTIVDGLGGFAFIFGVHNKFYK